MQSKTTILVRGLKYPEGHYLAPTHEAQPGGPLVPVPGAPVMLSMGGAGGVGASSSQRYIGWKVVPCDPLKVGGEDLVMTDRLPAGGNIKMGMAQVRYRWVYDPTPVMVEQTPEVLRAIARGEIEKVEIETVATTKSRRTPGGV